MSVRQTTSMDVRFSVCLSLVSLLCLSGRRKYFRACYSTASASGGGGNSGSGGGGGAAAAAVREGGGEGVRIGAWGIKYECRNLQ
eukprot:scaffold87683_cov62-Phaeocystis_antarctica.AAC.1